MAKEKIILALDLHDEAKALEIVDRYGQHIEVFKVGLELFSSAGPSVIRAIHDRGKKVFLDLKLHDIPNTMAQASLAAARMGVFMFNVHTSAGVEAMKRCRETVQDYCDKEGINRPKMLGVTVLTSIGDETLKDDLCVGHSVKTHVKHLAKLALDAGLDGVVASAHEASSIKKRCGSDFIAVTPGIRPSWSPPDDQKRTMTPKDAIKAGADYLVMGRSILKQPDPDKALDLVIVEILTV
jgi:orotidine-5'-phosphate decarboxylase